MKKTLSMLGIFLLAIYLSGAYNPAQLAIAEKYSPFFGKDYEIQVTPTPGYLHGVQNCGVSEEIGQVYGCQYVETKDVEVASFLDDERFEFTVLHEIAHAHFDTDQEMFANWFARMIMDWRNNL